MPFSIWFWIFFHTILSLKPSSAQEHSDAIFVNSPLCKKAGIQCADDCLTLLVCGAGDTTPIESVSCGSTSPKTPYCTKNTCSATIDTCPTTTASIFQCTDIGIYPDPKVCTRFRECSEVGILASYWQCLSGFNFNSKNGLCDKHASCDTIDCSNNLNQIVAFKSNPRFYAVCYRGLSGQVESAVYKCSENLIFNPKTQTCDYECVSSGSFTDLTDCHKYFVCTGTVGNLKWTRIECPKSYFFNGTMCVRELSTCSSLSNPPVTDPVDGTTTVPDRTTTVNQPPGDTVPDTTTTVNQPPVDTVPDTTTSISDTTTTVSLPPTDTDPDDITAITTQGPPTTDIDPETTTTTTTENPPLEPDISTTVKPTKKPITSIPYR